MVDRQLELAIEGQYWFDLLRQHDMDPAGTISKLATQNRGRLNYNSSTNTLTFEPAFSTPTDGSFKLPYPAADLTSDPLLNQAPVPYY